MHLILVVSVGLFRLLWGPLKLWSVSQCIERKFAFRINMLIVVSTLFCCVSWLLVLRHTARSSLGSSVMRKMCRGRVILTELVGRDATWRWRTPVQFVLSYSVQPHSVWKHQFNQMKKLESFCLGGKLNKYWLKWNDWQTDESKQQP